MSGDSNLIASASAGYEHDPLLTPEQVAKRSNTAIDGVGDDSSRKLPLLRVIRSGGAAGAGATALRGQQSRATEQAKARNLSSKKRDFLRLGVGNMGVK